MNQWNICLSISYLLCVAARLMTFLISIYYQFGGIKVLLLLLLLLLVTMAALVFYEPLSFEMIKVMAADSVEYVQRHPLRGIALFTLFYFIICILPTPFISVFTMVAGYLFGNVIALLITSFVSALGGTVMFLLVRYILRDWVQSKVVKKAGVFQQAAQGNSFAVALSLRLIPGMPFPVPAIVLALSQLSVIKFYVSTQLGLFVSLLVYVNAGRSLSQVRSIHDIFSLELIVSLSLLAILPLVISMIQRKVSQASA